MTVKQKKQITIIMFSLIRPFQKLSSDEEQSDELS